MIDLQDFDNSSDYDETEGLTLAQRMFDLVQDEHEPEQPIDSKVVQIYEKLGDFLAKYRSGKMSKAFHALPYLKNWEHVMMLTNPDRWSPQAVEQATKLFSTNQQNTNVVKFYRLVLLEHVRESLAAHKKLNSHLYAALNQAIFKPRAFFTGIIIPLIKDEKCRMREISLVCTVLQKSSIPVMYAGAAIMTLIECAASGPVCLTLRVLLDKKYTLPTVVIKAVVAFFITPTESPTVQWQQAFLVFCQRYSNSLDADQVLALKESALNHPHIITQEIIHELDC